MQNVRLPLLCRWGRGGVSSFMGVIGLQLPTYAAWRPRRREALANNNNNSNNNITRLCFAAKIPKMWEWIGAFTIAVDIASNFTIVTREYKAFFARMQNFKKATNTCIMPVCLSVCLSVCSPELSFHRADFHEVWYLSIFWKSVEKIQVSLNSYKNNCHFTWISTYFRSYLIRFFLE